VALGPTSRSRTTAPEIMTSGTSLESPRRGEFWTAYTPGQPDDAHQPRPVLVVSEDVRNRLRDDVIVVPAFSAGRIGPTRVPVPANSGGLPHDSVLFCEEVTTIDKDFLQRGPLGPRVEPGTVAAVVRAIRRATGDVVPS
jgi:mRNA interferase MazF